MNFKNVLLAIILYLFFSTSSIFMKFASMQNTLFKSIIFYGLSMGTLGVFAILWQKLLTKFDLSKVYIFKATTIIWGMVFGFLIFKESVTINMIIGSIITIIGISIIIGGKENE